MIFPRLFNILRNNLHHVIKNTKHETIYDPHVYKQITFIPIAILF